MQTATSKLLFSCIHRHLRRSPKGSEICLPLIGFCASNNSSRGMSSERRRNARSEELFLRSLNFGDDAEEQATAQQPEAPPCRPSARRPVRGAPGRVKETLLNWEEGNYEAADGLFPDFDSDELDRRGTLSRDGKRDQQYEDFVRSPQSTFEDFGRVHCSEYSGTKLWPRSTEGARREHFGEGSPMAGDGSHNVDRIGDSLAKKVDLQGAGRRKKVEKLDQKPQPMIAESVAQEAQPEEADEILREMKQTGLIPKAVAMLDGLCKDGLIQEAMKLFRSIREKGTMPEVVIYTATVEGLCKVGRFDEAKRVFRKMQTKGIEPNAFSYKVLIQALRKGKKLEDSVEFCLEMLDAGHSLTPGTLVTLLDGFCKEKGIEEAENVVKRLQERGFVLDERAVREHLDKKGPFSPLIWEAISGKKNSQEHC